MKTLAVALAVVVGTLVGFYGGFHAGRGNVPASPAPPAPVSATTPTAAATGGGSLAGAAGGRNPGGGGFGAGRGTAGTVSNVTASGFTVHNPATGVGVKVVLDPAVTVRRTVAGQVADLKEGMTVAVTGQAAPDGTVTATSVTIAPATP